MRQFYQQLLPSLPAGVRLVQDDATLGGNSAAASIWHLELDGRPLPFGEGTTFVRTVVDGLISYIRCARCPCHSRVRSLFGIENGDQLLLSVTSALLLMSPLRAEWIPGGLFSIPQQHSEHIADALRETPCGLHEFEPAMTTYR